MKRIFLSAGEEETRLALEEDGALIDYLVERRDQEELVGRIYKGVVRNVVPAVKGRFIDLGLSRNGFLRDEDCLGRPPTEGSGVLVQVIKDGTDTKGPLVTEKISLPGRYAAALTDTDYIGISKKIRAEEKRTALRALCRKAAPPGMGLVVRTAAGGAALSDVEKDIGRLAALWETIRRRARLVRKPGLLYRDTELSVRAVRDFLTEDVAEIVTDSGELCGHLEELAGADRVRLEKGPLFKNHHLEDAIHRLFDREVPLPSGGSVIIEHTEALTAIDVNSGGFRRAGIPHEEAAYLVNLEAAAVIAAQIRMRGIGGMILIDFIDMEQESRKAAVVGALRRETAKDRVKTVVLGMTALGLVEMTRKRTARRLAEHYYEPCPCCGGTGRRLTGGAVVSRIFQALAEEKDRGGIPRPLLVTCHPDIAERLSGAETQFRMKALLLRPVRVEADPKMSWETFSILADTEFDR